MDSLPAKIETLLATAVNDNIETLEDFMLEQPQLDIPASESFCHGMYIREIVIPADTILTGGVWKHPYVDIMISGDITVATPDGIKRLQGYHRMQGVAGRKRAGYAHEDTQWITIHRTDLELPEPGAMRDLLTFMTMDEYIRYTDSLDFMKFLHESGITPEQAWDQMLDGEIINMDLDDLGLQLAPSSRHGNGLFSIYPIEPETLICPAQIDGLRTEAGRYTNHSADPNCEMRWLNTQLPRCCEIGLVSLRRIHAGEELTCNYRHPGLIIVEVES